MYNSSLKLASIIQDSDHLFFLLLCLTSKSFNHPFLSLSALQGNSYENGSILPNRFFIQTDVKVDRWQNTGGKKKKDGKGNAHSAKYLWSSLGGGRQYFIPIS